MKNLRCRVLIKAEKVSVTRRWRLCRRLWCVVLFAIVATRIFCRTNGLVVTTTAGTACSFWASACDMTEADTFRAAMRFFIVGAYWNSSVADEDMRRHCRSGEYKFHNL